MREAIEFANKNKWPDPVPFRICLEELGCERGRQMLRKRLSAEDGFEVLSDFWLNFKDTGNEYARKALVVGDLDKLINKLKLFDRDYLEFKAQKERVVFVALIRKKRDERHAHRILSLNRILGGRLATVRVRHGFKSDKENDQIHAAILEARGRHMDHDAIRYFWYNRLNDIYYIEFNGGVTAEFSPHQFPTAEKGTRPVKGLVTISDSRYTVAIYSDHGEKLEFDPSRGGMKDVFRRTCYSRGTLIKRQDLSQKNVGKKIAMMRYRRRYSQRDLAELSGIDQSTICRIEKRHQTPSLRTIERIAEALEVTVNELLGLVNTERVSRPLLRADIWD